MVAYTAVYDLPYAESSDQFCGGWSTTQALAEAVDAVLDGFDIDADRTELVPYARVSLATQYSADLITTASTGLIAYDTVDVDTAGMADVVRDSQSISVGTTGLFLGGAYVWHGNTGVAGVSGNTTELYTVINRATDDDENDHYSMLDRGTGFAPRRNVSGMFNADDYTSISGGPQMGTYIRITGTTTVGAVFTIGTPAIMFAWWVSDSP